VLSRGEAAGSGFSSQGNAVTGRERRRRCEHFPVRRRRPIAASWNFGGSLGPYGPDPPLCSDKSLLDPPSSPNHGTTRMRIHDVVLKAHDAVYSEFNNKTGLRCSKSPEYLFSYFHKTSFTVFKFQFPASQFKAWM
jgi:hypothetical protein